MPRLSAATWTLLLLLAALLCWVVAVRAQPYGRAGAPATNHCAPSVLAIEPDGRQIDSAQFPVEVIWRAKGQHWAEWFTFPVLARCDETRLAVLTVLRRLPETPGLSVSVGGCR